MPFRHLRIAAFAAIAALSGIVFAQTTDRKVKVVTSSADRYGAHLVGQLDGRTVDLYCYNTVPECVVAKPSEYLMADAPADNYIYADCFNVYLYTSDKNGGRGDKIGLYCLVPP